MQDTIGIDVSKSLLDAFCLSTGIHRQFANSASGCSKLLGMWRDDTVFQLDAPPGVMTS